VRDSVTARKRGRRLPARRFFAVDKDASMNQLRWGSFALALVSAAVLAACASQSPKPSHDFTKVVTWTAASAGTPMNLYNHEFRRLMDKDGSTSLCLTDMVPNPDGRVTQPLYVRCWTQVPPELQKDQILPPAPLSAGP
jgi:hypothetical protein